MRLGRRVANTTVLPARPLAQRALTYLPLLGAAVLASGWLLAQQQRDLSLEPVAESAALLRPLARGPETPRDLEASLPQSHYLTAGSVTTATLSAENEPAAKAIVIRVERGDTLMGLLTREGVAREDALQAIDALTDVFSPRDLRPGFEMKLVFAKPDAALTDSRAALQSIAFQPSVEQSIQVARVDAGGFAAQSIDRPLTRETSIAAGVIEGSLFEAGQASGLPTPLIIELIRALSYDVDFQREIHPGDRFEVVYEAYLDERGEMAKTGRILFAGLTLANKRLGLYGFEPAGGSFEFFDANGKSVKKALLRTPIDGARLSSKFGMRKHPILGYSKMHKGVDFAAPTGTPIFAAGDGVIEMAGWNGGYGRYIRIKHTATHKTAYAHLSRFAGKIGKGSRVKQGDVIGYVGSTGRSTGPHLHYEVLIDNKQINPLDVKVPVAQVLAGKDLESFKRMHGEIERLRKSLEVGPLVAGTTGSLAAN